MTLFLDEVEHFCLHTYVQPLQVKIALGVIAMEVYSTHPESPELEPLHRMEFCVILRTSFLCRGNNSAGNIVIIFLASLTGINISIIWWGYLIRLYLKRRSWTQSCFQTRKYLLVKVVMLTIIFYS